jgi:hypothetical protein
VPADANKLFQAVFCCVVDPPDLEDTNLNSPPELKKCLAAFDDGQDTVIVPRSLAVQSAPYTPGQVVAIDPAAKVAD